MSHTIKIRVKNAHNPSAVPVDGKYPVDIIRKRLTVDEVYPDNLRYNPTTGTVQYSPDGINWYDDTSADPRNNPAVLGRQGATDNCPAAKSVTEYFRRYIALVVSVLSAGATIVQGASAIVGFLNLLGGYGILWELITGVFGTLTGYGATAINTAFTSDQYDKLQCILFCTMSNSKMDAGGLAVTKQMVTAQLNATAAPIVNLMLDMMGFAGVTRAGTFYTVAGSCAGCPSCDWSFCVDLTWLWDYVRPANCPQTAACPPVLTRPTQGKLGTYTGRPAWEWERTLGDNALRFGKTFPLTLPAGATLTNIKLWFIRTSGGGNTDGFSKDLWPLSQAVQCAVGAFHNSPITYPIGISGPTTETFMINIGSNVGGDTGQGFYVQMELNGTGNRPGIPSVPKVYT